MLNLLDFWLAAFLGHCFFLNLKHLWPRAVSTASSERSLLQRGPGEIGSIPELSKAVGPLKNSMVAVFCYFHP